MIMAYDEHEDRDMRVDESDFYEDETLYEPADTFAEQIGESAGSETEYDAAGTPAESSRVEEGFAETLSAEKNPHLGDQMADESLKDEATRDYMDEEMEE
jgi:hypothetical protein